MADALARRSYRCSEHAVGHEARQLGRDGQWVVGEVAESEGIAAVSKNITPKR
jgi:hypothetical protein